MGYRTFIEFAEYHSPDGQIYYFDDDDRFMISHTGMGMPPISYISQRGPFQHGNTLVDYRLDPRIIQLVYRENGCSRQEYWDNRDNLLNFLRPNRQSVGDFNLGKLRRIQPDGTTRDIDVLIEQGPIFEPRDTGRWDEWAYMETLRFIAPDPTFYDPTVQTETWVSDVVITELEFPITFPIEFSESLLNLTGQTITYTGNWLSFPTIVITGPIGGFTITNDTTGEFIRLNYTLGSGETVTITLDYGNKTVTSSDGTNLIGTVTTDSDLATFHIAPDPEAAGGVNSFSIVGAGVTAATQIVMTWLTRFIGI